MKKIFFIAIVAIIGFSSCDYIKDPIQNTTISGDTTSNVTKRKILLEEFTGQKCENCPNGALQAEYLASQYPGQVIIVEINAGYFATPDATGDFTADYRCAAGNTYNTTFPPVGYPAGMVDRIKSNGTYVLNKNDWENVILNVKDSLPIVKIGIKNTYNLTSRNLTTKIKSTWLQTGTTDYNLVAYIIEDSLISPQQDGQNVVANYVHNHTLRAAINGAWGEALTDSLMGDSVVKTYSYTISPNWNAANCSVVAYIYDANTQSPTHYEIYQVEEAKVE